MLCECNNSGGPHQTGRYLVYEKLLWSQQIPHKESKILGISETSIIEAIISKQKVLLKNI